MRPDQTTTPSRYQQQVLDFVKHGSGHGIVKATAGSGKTSTLVLVARELEPTLLATGERACFLAFNRATAAELRSRLPDSVEATTLHALGRSILVGAQTTASGAKPEAAKYRLLAETVTSERGAPRSATISGYLGRLAQVARLELTPAEDLDAVANLAERYRLEAPVTGADVENLHACLEPLLSRGAQEALEGSFDFTDMVYVPVLHELPPPRYAFICVDEAQDLSALALSFVMRLLEHGTRALFVGDPRQAIYAFAGADSRAMARIAERTKSTELPLSVSYRCPIRHIALARRYAPEMEPKGASPLGTVRLISSDRLVQDVAPGDLIIARTNQDLVGIALQLAARGLSTRVLGTDLAGRAAELADRLFEDGDLTDAQERISASAAAETSNLERDLICDLRLPSALQGSAERHAALELALKTGPANVLQALDHLFAGADERAPPIVLSSIHRAKGREAERVYLLDVDTLAAAPTRSAEEDASEENVLFVALTRAKRELILVESEVGAAARRLDAETRKEDLPRRWDDVLRFALRMNRAARDSPQTEVRRIIRTWQRTLSTKLREASW
ncbi:MAG: AAA family ATPase [Trueperaceae bacterium]|nr:AAA family ATPase [Trueperaceae bacterium]